MYYFFRPEDKRHLTHKLLPKRATRILKSALENLCLKRIEVRRVNCMVDQNDDTLDFQVQRREVRTHNMSLSKSRLLIQPVYLT